jgi:phage terminase large subunit-like protein
MYASSDQEQASRYRQAQIVANPFHEGPPLAICFRALTMRQSAELHLRNEH